MFALLTLLKFSCTVDCPVGSQYSSAAGRVGRPKAEPGRLETASYRLGRATNALRGKEDSQIFGKVGALLIGVGIGVGVGLLIAPASGEETRADIADKVSDFAKKVPDPEREPHGATGTYGE